MATGPKNAKSQSVTLRMPHELIIDMHLTKEPGESVSSFLNAAVSRETEQRFKRIAKERGIPVSKIRDELHKEAFSLSEKE